MGSLHKFQHLKDARNAIFGAIHALPVRFVAVDDVHNLRVRNALQAALDNIEAAHREITKELNR